MQIHQLWYNAFCIYSTNPVRSVLWVKQKREKWTPVPWHRKNISNGRNLFWLGMAFSKGRSAGGRNHTAISPTCSQLTTAGIPPVIQNHLLEGSIVSSWFTTIIVGGSLVFCGMEKPKMILYPKNISEWKSSFFGDSSTIPSLERWTQQDAGDGEGSRHEKILEIP